jgi:hypothetical protein
MIGRGLVLAPFLVSVNQSRTAARRFVPSHQQTPHSCIVIMNDHQLGKHRLPACPLLQKNS